MAPMAISARHADTARWLAGRDRQLSNDDERARTHISARRESANDDALEQREAATAAAAAARPRPCRRRL